ncbi:tryptophan halogenase family protein [Hirschia maritima]|uniref:tryptophan halogenase family protein n=1 Tax=Hirschia maritima TaxID=1121961 RepID=UPI00036F95FC|nr:tryptophan halogenase family protein [Hirschia maritima]
MEKPIEKIVIVGGGTAGWLCAAILASKHLLDPGSNKKIVLVESPDIQSVGVGEGTWPTMRRTLNQIGISEQEFLSKCNASFKQGTRFLGWRDGSQGDDFFHPFSLPVGFPKINPGTAWLENSMGTDFAKVFSVQPHLCELNLAPKHFKTPEYNGMQNYGYHLDAGKFADLLRRHSVQKLNVQHIQANVEQVHRNESGNIFALTTDSAADITGDFFVDCTGFHAKLISQTMGAEFNSTGRTLFADRALVVSKEYERPDSPVASQTNSVALSAGWVWDIGLKDRRGLGYVYSSSHISEEVALNEFVSHLCASEGDFDEGTVRSLKFESGYRPTPWINNCIAIGLSAGFVEPLEASSIMMTELASNFLADRWPVSDSIIPILSKQFNDIFSSRWLRIVDFLKLHYCLSKRQTDFWMDNTSSSSIPDSLAEKLELWKFHTPWRDDFTYAQEMFPTASYQYILYGMKNLNPITESSCVVSQNTHAAVLSKVNQLKGVLPSNRDLIGSCSIL